jgi:predicted dehydrogenase
MGRRHVQVAAKAGCELVGVFDVKAESLTLAQQEANLPAAVLYTDLDRLYTDAKPELVIISTTADSHAALTAQAAERGAKFILVEKPMAQSLADCDRMIEVCRAHGVRLAVNHQMRFMEQYTHPRVLGYSEAFGGIQSMTVVGGNFGMANNGTHYFEAFRYMMGEDVASVSAWFSPEIVPNPRGPQFMDRAGSLRAVTTGGKRFYMDVSSDQGHGVS